MKRVFTVRLKRGQHVNEIAKSYECVAANAKEAIDKATEKFKKDESWAAAVLVDAVIHRGPAL